VQLSRRIEELLRRRVEERRMWLRWRLEMLIATSCDLAANFLAKRYCSNQATDDPYPYRATSPLKSFPPSKVSFILPSWQEPTHYGPSEDFQCVSEYHIPRLIYLYLPFCVFRWRVTVCQTHGTPVDSQVLNLLMCSVMEDKRYLTTGSSEIL
jgi:hypothetical protein